MYKSITYHTGIFNDTDLQFLLDDIEFFSKSNKNGEVNNYWGPGVKQFSEPINTRKLRAGNENFEIISKKCVDILGMVPHGIYYYLWGPGSYIPWHDDTDYLSAFTIYMNSSWSHNFGGIFQYQLDGDVKSYLPLINTGISQTGGVEHSTTIQSTNSPIRKSIQCWFEDRKVKKTTI